MLAWGPGHETDSAESALHLAEKLSVRYKASRAFTAGETDTHPILSLTASSSPGKKALAATLSSSSASCGSSVSSPILPRRKAIWAAANSSDGST